MRTKLTMITTPDAGGDPDVYEAFGETDGAACLALANEVQAAVPICDYADFWNCLSEIVEGERMAQWWVMGEGTFKILATEVPDAAETEPTE